MERKGVVTFMGNPLTLLGTEVKAGNKAPAFSVLEKDLSEVKLADFSGKVKVISVTPLPCAMAPYEKFRRIL